MQKLTKMPWSPIIVTIYIVSGYFIGHQFSTNAGLLLTCVSAIAGFFIAKITKDTGLISKLLVMCLPIILLVFALLQTPDEVLDKKFLSGTWTAQDRGKVFTVNINENTAFLSMEPGLKNIEYQVSMKNDSLILSADPSNHLSWHVAKVNTEVVLDAGGGLFFRRELEK